MSSARSGARATVASNSATESRPPESPSAIVEPRGTRDASALSTAAVTRLAPFPPSIIGSARRVPASTRDHLLELAITEDLVLARFEQRIERLLLKIAHTFD